MAKPLWHDVYLVAQKSIYAGGSFTSPAKTFLSTDIGADLGKCAIPVLGSPDFEAGRNIESFDILNGVFLRKTDNYYVDTQLPSVKLSFELDVKTLSYFLWLFYQNGAIQLPSTFRKIFSPYTATSCEVWGTICRRLSLTLDESHVIDGAVCRSITISGTSGSAVNVDVELVGRTFSSTFDWNAQSSVAVFPEAPVITTSMMVCNLGQFDSFSISLQNGYQPLYYNNVTPYEFRLGVMQGTVELTAPFQSTSNLVKAVVPDVSYIKFNSLNNDFTFEADVVSRQVRESSPDEIMQTYTFDIGFRVVTSIGAKFTINDNVNRGIPSSRT